MEKFVLAKNINHFCFVRIKKANMLRRKTAAPTKLFAVCLTVLAIEAVSLAQNFCCVHRFAIFVFTFFFYFFYLRVCKTFIKTISSSRMQWNVTTNTRPKNPQSFATELWEKWRGKKIERAKIHNNNKNNTSNRALCIQNGTWRRK